MQKLKVRSGPLKGMIGEGAFFPQSGHFFVSFPDRKKPYYTEEIPPEQIIVLRDRAAGTADPILEKREFATLQTKKEDVQIIGCKVSCGSVWCPECFVRKGGSKRIANRLAQLDWRATRQVVLTCDLKKFNGSGQQAFETLKDIEAINQFIHNLKRTAKIKIVDWVWILEWHTDGAPHWHLFIQTEKGKKGKIGNEKLLKHWKHGLVFESYIQSQKHWQRFTSYFGSNGYFDPNAGCESKDKSHQLELPEWAKQVTYRIRKTGSMVKKDNQEKELDGADEKEANEEYIEDQNEKNEDDEPKSYQEILNSCGQSTMCQIRRGDSYLIWTKIPIAYEHFKQYPGHYIEQTGFLLQMDLEAFFVFLYLNSHEIRELEQLAEKAA